MLSPRNSVAGIAWADAHAAHEQASAQARSWAQGSTEWVTVLGSIASCQTPSFKTMPTLQWRWWCTPPPPQQGGHG